MHKVDLQRPWFYDRLIKVMAFYDCSPRLNGDAAMELINSVVKYIGGVPSNVQFGSRDGTERHPNYTNALIQAENHKFDDYKYLIAAKYYEKGNVRDIRFAVGSTFYAFWGQAYNSTFEVLFDINDFSEVDIFDITKILLEFQKPVYGIGYSMPFRYSPHSFASTSISSAAPSWIAKRHAEFLEEYREGGVQRGKFRDVFPQNIISSRHFGASIEGKCFKDWVAQRSGSKHASTTSIDHGELRQINGDTWLWNVDENALPQVRAAMLKAGLLMVKE